MALLKLMYNKTSDNLDAKLIRVDTEFSLILEFEAVERMNSQFQIIFLMCLDYLLDLFAGIICLICLTCRNDLFE